LLIDDVVEVDRAGSRVVARMPTHEDLPLTRTQRAHPVRHPRHINGGLMVHMTGMVGFVHAYYVSDLRHADGWIGYGGRIQSARFRALAPPGEPILIECVGVSERRSADKLLSNYRFKFTQGETLVYESLQTALWMKVA
jgi:3-hydroxymyristoyl/3-hydroxydecanoyl-(acyl carrier protein) dehydratase